MSIPQKDLIKIKLEIRDQLRTNFEAIINYYEKMKEHENALVIGEWFNLKDFCTNASPDLLDLYNQANKICGWDK